MEKLNFECDTLKQHPFFCGEIMNESEVKLTEIINVSSENGKK